MRLGFRGLLLADTVARAKRKGLTGRLVVLVEARIFKPPFGNETIGLGEISRRKVCRQLMHSEGEALGDEMAAHRPASLRDDPREHCGAGGDQAQGFLYDDAQIRELSGALNGDVVLTFESTPNLAGQLLERVWVLQEKIRCASQCRGGGLTTSNDKNLGTDISLLERHSILPLDFEDIGHWESQLPSEPGHVVERNTH